MIKSFKFFKKRYFAKQFHFHAMNLRFFFDDTTKNVNTFEMLSLEPEKLIRKLTTGCAETSNLHHCLSEHYYNIVLSNNDADSRF